MKKNIKKSLFGLLAVPIILTPMMCFVGCGSSNTLTYVAKRTEATMELVEKSTNFKQDFNISVYQGMNGPDYNKKGEFVSLIPNYSDEESELDINTIIIQHSENGELSSPYVKLRMVYDAIWGYSYKVICENEVIMNEVSKKTVSKEAQEAINNLDSVITSFRAETAKQENELKSLKLYLYDVGESKWNTSPAYNAVYNYEKKYKSFVRAGLDLAISTTEVVNLVYDNLRYSELKPGEVLSGDEEQSNLTRNVSTKKALNILDMYYIFLIEKNISNVSGGGEYVSFYNEIYRSYLDFIASLYNGLSNKANYSGRLTGIKITKLESQEEVVLAQFNETNEIFKHLDLNNLVSMYKGDVSKLSELQKREYERLKLFYHEILRSWWEYAVTTIFSTGVID